MSEIIEIYRKMHEGQKQLCIAVLSDMEIDGNERRIQKLRDLVKELEGKIKAMTERRRKWEKVIEDSEMLMEELVKLPNGSVEVDRLKIELMERVAENKELLSKTCLDGTNEKRVRITLAIDKLIKRRIFAGAVVRKLTTVEKDDKRQPGMAKLGDFMPPSMKEVAANVGNGQ